jgi:hypothetical protein
MSTQTKRKRGALKAFEVAYCVEQGFSIIVQAKTADEAEDIVTARLDDECDVLAGSTRVHYDGFVASSSEVTP